MASTASTSTGKPETTHLSLPLAKRVTEASYTSPREYPVAPERSGRPEDLQNYPIFLQNLRNAFQAAGKSWGLSITMPSSFWYLQHFDVVKLEPIVDWFNMMGECPSGH
jgi:hypothetical protein